jgi:hypothetical protein
MRLHHQRKPPLSPPITVDWKWIMDFGTPLRCAQRGLMIPKQTLDHHRRCNKKSQCRRKRNWR